MNEFSEKSKSKLLTCHPDLQFICHEVLKIMDISVLSGYRGEAEQNGLVANGASQLKYPLSNHNQEPSKAVDIAPYPIDWDGINRFHELAGVVKTIAYERKINIKWGGDWKTFKDYPHFELV